MSCAPMRRTRPSAQRLAVSLQAPDPSGALCESAPTPYCRKGPTLSRGEAANVTSAVSGSAKRSSSESAATEAVRPYGHAASSAETEGNAGSRVRGARGREQDRDEDQGSHDHGSS